MGRYYRKFLINVSYSRVRDEHSYLKCRQRHIIQRLVMRSVI
jgi:hypothetical protein